MSHSVASSEPSSVGLPVNSNWSSVGGGSGDSMANNSFRQYSHHRQHQDVADIFHHSNQSTKYYSPSEHVAAAAASRSSQQDDDDELPCCPLCGGNAQQQRMNRTSQVTPTNDATAYIPFVAGPFKTTGLDCPTTTASSSRTTRTATDHHSNSNNKNKTMHMMSDFELASVLQTAELSQDLSHSGRGTTEVAAAAAMGACWVCIAAIADANNGGQEQQQQGALVLSYSTLESFHDEQGQGQRAYVGYSPNTTTLSTSTFGVQQDVFENDYFQQQVAISDNGMTEPRNINEFGTPTTTVVYIGDYDHRGQRHGPHGELIWDNGDRYVGSFVSGKRTGTGTFFHRDGSSYTGDWLDNHMHGKGQRTFSNGDVYVGQYRHGERCGGPDCKLKFSNGDLYVGTWDSNYFHGFGRYYFADGTALEGTFEHGKKQGKFKRQKPSGNLDILRYENDQVVGQGVRWNAARTKTWLLRTVVDKKQQLEQAKHHRRVVSEHNFRISRDGYTQIRDRRRRSSSPSPASAAIRPDMWNQDRSVSVQSVEPLVEAQVMTVTKKVGRIPIAQAVSIGYDCELGEAIRDTNPAFWAVGDFSNGVANNESNKSFV